MGEDSGPSDVPCAAGPRTDAASLMVQVLFTSESNGDEYWVEVRRPEGYPA